MNNKWKWISIGTVGSLFVLSHIGMIGMIARKESPFPALNLPTGDYTSYQVEAGRDGYRITYKANDPTIMRVERDIKKKAGFLGLGNNTVQTTEEYSHGGATHQGGPVSNRTTWQDPSTMGVDSDGKKLSAKTVACIEAAGGGKSTGKLVGGSIGAAVGTTGLASIPYVGWVLAGAATMIGMDAGSDIGGQMAQNYAGCDPDLIDNVSSE